MLEREKKKSKTLAVAKQRTEFAVLRYWVQAVNPATNGVMSMPALVVNERVVAMGRVLKANEIVTLLQKSI